MRVTLKTAAAIAVIAFISLCILAGRQLLFASAQGEVIKDVAYGAAASNKLDIYKPVGAGPFPALFYVHGGGWWNGDKQYISQGDIDHIVSKGVALVAVNYRNLVEAARDGLFPPLMGPLDDTRAAYDYIEKNGGNFGIDGSRIAVYGGSAGGFNALWLGLSLQKTEPQHAPKAIGGIDAQTTIDPIEMRDWVSPSINYGGHAFGLPEADFPSFLAGRERFLGYISTLSPSYLVSQESPPIVLMYAQGLQQAKNDHMSLVHSPKFGAGFAEVARSNGQHVTLIDGADGNPDRNTAFFDFLIAHVLK